MASSSSKPVSLLLSLLTIVVMLTMNVKGQGVSSTSSSASWCVVRSDASYNVLQTALDYACGAGADCLSLQPDGLCFLPNTIQAHASYAFNSYYQKRARAPGSCDFSGTATIAQTDPSYGSCVYPSSTSGAGGSNTPTSSTSITNSNMSSPTFPSPTFGGLSPEMNAPFIDNSKAPSKEQHVTWFLLFFFSLLILSIIS
ncbi:PLASMODESMATA CALLOSE-BINDING PROTEIN 3-like [Vicia villosa]|uniref:PLASMODESMATA CALLOSE-BINDING PROTEIN 3-like n=1 Tax=Vicia villosa TaxID=3911 RepID=UPI00273B2E6B|nr:PLASMODESMATA CALLOSE-BINDING PROTEIN 3-like [Vicia villosa]